MRCDSRFQIPNSKLAFELAERIFLQFGTNDVYEIAASAGVKIAFQKWFPVTFGEFERRMKTIIVNENAAVSFEKIVAHELGHYFLREFDVKNIVDEEVFCDEFAVEILRGFNAKEQRTES